jgi:hypothetical protein
VVGSVKTLQNQVTVSFTQIEVIGDSDCERSNTAAERALQK